jgi:hypothetical protein
MSRQDRVEDDGFASLADFLRVFGDEVLDLPPISQGVYLQQQPKMFQDKAPKGRSKMQAPSGGGIFDQDSPSYHDSTGRRRAEEPLSKRRKAERAELNENEGQRRAKSTSLVSALRDVLDLDTSSPLIDTLKAAIKEVRELKKQEQLLKSELIQARGENELRKGSQLARSFGGSA